MGGLEWKDFMRTFSVAFASPCKDCPDRHHACHDKCEKYMTSKREYAKLKSMKKREGR